MLKKDKNGFIDVIYREGLQPDQFTAAESDEFSSPVFMLTCNNTPFRFCVSHPEDNYRQYSCFFTEFSPKYQFSPDWPVNRYFNDINEIYAMFASWLQNDVKAYLEEQEISDMWEQMKQESLTFKKMDSSLDMDYFNEHEIRAIQQITPLLREYIEEKYSPSEEQMNEINSKLDYLTDSAERLNKFDWKCVLFNIIFGILLNLSLDTESGRILWSFVKHMYATSLQMLQ